MTHPLRNHLLLSGGRDKMRFRINERVIAEPVESVDHSGPPAGRRQSRGGWALHVSPYSQQLREGERSMKVKGTK